ncbi:ABC-three component system protein [Bradyrhizobium sp. SZCCHNS3002]|uniref:ABC-three component system protein n=1 Tax=Bradyrhizobium sp. SZCCHNS3002 TaxID=3057310 RepID=UPI0028E88343|nr:ABC-three component system protein [Bradyrhizobium sp. SZCCHNS3002]
MTTSVVQTGAKAGGDVVGGHKVVETHYHLPGEPAGIVGQLLVKLQGEIKNNERVRHTIEDLARFHTKRSIDGIEGLEAKLEAGGRANEYLAALEKKEMFVKLLERWSLYASAQEIFVYLLAQAEHHFNLTIHPQIEQLSPVQVNALINQLIITPTINQVGADVFVLNHNVCMGMIYWLAEQCFVRWHQ